MSIAVGATPTAGSRWAKVIDQTRCIGCHACSTACKSENEVPLGVQRTYVKYVDVGRFPEVRRAFQVTRCNQCADPPCTHACPTAAMFARADGIVDFDKSICIGCKACIAACPYDAIFINPEDHSAEKCNFCAQRLDLGLEPACVVVCPVEAILVGDLDDPSSLVAEIVARDDVRVRHPEKKTSPKLFYKGATEATLDPLAARRPVGGLFLWSEQGHGSHLVVSGNPLEPKSSAEAMLAYDVPHRAPWDWRLSLYTWTKGIASGAYFVALVAMLAGILEPTGLLWTFAVPIVAGAFLAATGLILIADLDHPERFYLIFLRPQWRSWLVRGAFVIAGYTAVLAAHFLVALTGGGALAALAVLGLPLSIATAIYTAYLFAQARARDLWQSPLLPAHLLVQAALAGTAALLLAAAWLEPAASPALAWILGGTSAMHLGFVAAEIMLGHPTEHARLAVLEMTSRTYRGFFWSGVVLVALAIASPWLGITGAIAALAGLLLHEHAYVQAGQAVPIA